MQNQQDPQLRFFSRVQPMARNILPVSFVSWATRFVATASPKQSIVGGFTMLQFRSVATMAAALVFANSASALWGPPPTPATSSAWALNVMLDIGGQKSSLLHQVYATGTAPPAYSKSTSKPSYADTTAFKGGWTLKATGSTIDDKAASAGDSPTGVITATSSASVGSLSAAFSTASGSAVTISVKTLVSKASF